MRNCDDEQAIKQAGRFYAAAHETSQAYKFTRVLPWEERINFAKTFGGIYSPEAYTSVSSRALSKLRSAHRYLFMRLTGWNGVESIDEEASVSSLTIGSDDSNEEFYDTRSRWLYAYAATIERERTHKQIAMTWPGSDLLVSYLHPAPSVDYQFRKGRYRISRVVQRLGLELNLEKIKLSKNIVSIVKSY